MNDEGDAKIVDFALEAERRSVDVDVRGGIRVGDDFPAGVEHVAVKRQAIAEIAGAGDLCGVVAGLLEASRSCTPC